MVKALEAPYEAGRRGAAWLKVKRARTRSTSSCSPPSGDTAAGRAGCRNLHLGARDPATGGFVMLGKTFKGMTDEMLAWQTERLLALETAREELTSSTSGPSSSSRSRSTASRRARATPAGWRCGSRA